MSVTGGSRARAPRSRILLVPAGIATIATTLFLAQGGFGGGSGDYDLALMVLGLPWTLLPWPERPFPPDFVWVVVTPFVLNQAAVAAAVWWLRKRYARRTDPAV